MNVGYMYVYIHVACTPVKHDECKKIYMRIIHNTNSLKQTCMCTCTTVLLTAYSLQVQLSTLVIFTKTQFDTKVQ